MMLTPERHTEWSNKQQENVAIGVVAVNGRQSSYCIASDCMMWRTNSIDSTDGYCGLAGFANYGVGG